MMITAMHKASLALLLVMTAGCATNDIQHYVAHDKALQAAGNVAYLHVPDNIMVDEINGKGRHYPLLEPFGRHYRGAVIELLPGAHTAGVIYHDRYGHTSRKTAVSFDVNAGVHFELRASRTTVNYSPRITFEVVAGRID